LQISGVLATNANLSTYDTSGIDFQIDYGFETGAGLVDLRVTGTYLDAYDYLAFSGGELVKLSGYFGGDPFWGSPATFAELQTNFSATFTRDNWGANLTARYMGATDDIAAAPANMVNKAESVTYFDVQGYYEWNNMSFTAGIRNLADEDPPYVSAYDDMNTLQFSYDTQGRYYYARASVAF
ncbi:MAG: TonB-dependent receptor, partial [Gammaproteobacteria bacterium]|nr:TonB-dependent receptor [Gammaproteobacteria bacterium]